MPSFQFEAQVASTDYQAVYLATQKSLDRHVAVKVYSPEVTANPAFARAFDRATKSMAKLNHVNLIAMFNSGEIEGMAYMVMEFVPGKSLISYRKDHKLPMPQAISIVKGITAGVAYAHDREVLHGGLSVDNILLNDKLEPKIGSFGFVIDTGENEYERFGAPELSEPSSIITPQVDIYSLGVILYELVSGSEFGENAKALTSFAGVNLKLGQVFKKATASDPDDRYDSAKELLDALKKVAPDAHGAASRLAASGKKKPAVSQSAIAVKRQVAAANRPVTTANRPVTAASTPLPSAGGGWKLFRNIIIIVLLLFAIKLAWNQKVAREAAMDNEPSEEEVVKAQMVEKAKAKARKLEQERLARMEKERREREKRQPEIVIEPEPEPEPEVIKDTWGSLGRLRDKLVAGNRLEMPDGTIRMGACEYLYIDKPMTWFDACNFAENYGGHVAVPNLDATMVWMSENFLEDNDQGIWLGVAKSSHSSWTLVDGLGWVPKTTPTGDGSYLAAEASGVLSALDENAARPFIIQWHRDGTNPGSLKNVLERTKDTLGNLQPVYPAGTKAYGARHYLYVPKAMIWEEAVKVAQLGGGHLTVSSGVAERFNLKKLVGQLNIENGIWLGGANDGSQWKWVTGETWKSPQWVNGVNINQKDAAVKVMADGKWMPQNRNQPASGFLIEWSDDFNKTAGKK